MSSPISSTIPKPPRRASSLSSPSNLNPNIPTRPRANSRSSSGRPRRSHRPKPPSTVKVIATTLFVYFCWGILSREDDDISHLFHRGSGSGVEQRKADGISGSRHGAGSAMGMTGNGIGDTRSSHTWDVNPSHFSHPRTNTESHQTLSSASNSTSSFSVSKSPWYLKPFALVYLLLKTVIYLPIRFILLTLFPTLYYAISTIIRPPLLFLLYLAYRLALPLTLGWNIITSSIRMFFLDPLSFFIRLLDKLGITTFFIYLSGLSFLGLGAGGVGWTISRKIEGWGSRAMEAWKGWVEGVVPEWMLELPGFGLKSRKQKGEGRRRIKGSSANREKDRGRIDLDEGHGSGAIQDSSTYPVYPAQAPGLPHYPQPLPQQYSLIAHPPYPFPAYPPPQPLLHPAQHFGFAPSISQRGYVPNYASTSSLFSGQGGKGKRIRVSRNSGNGNGVIARDGGNGNTRRGVTIVEPEWRSDENDDEESDHESTQPNGFGAGQRQYSPEEIGEAIGSDYINSASGQYAYNQPSLIPMSNGAPLTMLPNGLSAEQALYNQMGRNSSSPSESSSDGFGGGSGSIGSGKRKRATPGGKKRKKEFHFHFHGTGAETANGKKDKTVDTASVNEGSEQNRVDASGKRGSTSSSTNHTPSPKTPTPVRIGGNVKEGEAKVRKGYVAEEGDEGW